MVAMSGKTIPSTPQITRRIPWNMVQPDDLPEVVAIGRAK
jgi:hypothetical protein